MPVFVFSTAGLPAARRIERWESQNAAALIGLDVRADGPLEATEVNVSFLRSGWPGCAARPTRWSEHLR